MNKTRRIAGKRAKYAGDNFESQFENLCAIQGISVVAIPNCCKRVARHKLIQIKAPFDYCLCYNQRSAHVDTKSTKEDSFSYSMIKPHQIEELKKLSPGGPAGYIIALSDIGVFFVDVSILDAVRPRGCVDFSRAIYLGNRMGFDVRRIF